MRGTTPAVLIVTRRLEMPNAKSSISTCAASVAASKLSSGSPMPMNTTLVMPRRSPRSASQFAARQTWPTISALLKLPAKPCLPVAQKLQSRAQPTWEEMHSVLRVASPASLRRSGMSTVSTCPAAVRAAHFTTPSVADCGAPKTGALIVASRDSLSRSGLAMFVMAEKSSTPSR